ncbi:Uncharacterised protein [uncultured archaeon]|nr:Uncharacterised protein [uncultured archaeon]
MIEEKKRKLERKKAKKIKEMKKQGTINLKALRREIYTYQFRLIRQPTYNPPLITKAGRFNIAIKRKEQDNVYLEVRK